MKPKFTLTRVQQIELNQDGIRLQSDDLFTTDHDVFDSGFLYSRNWGVFSVSIGTHQFLMYKLLSYEHGVMRLRHLEDKDDPMTWYDLEDAAEEYIKQSGVAYRSGVGYHSSLYLHKVSNLVPKERNFFADLGFTLQEL